MYMHITGYMRMYIFACMENILLYMYLYAYMLVYACANVFQTSMVVFVCVCRCINIFMCMYILYK